MKKIKDKFKQKEVSPRHKMWRKITLYTLAFALPLVYVAFLSDSNYIKHKQLDEKLKEIETENAKIRSYLEEAHTSDEIKNSKTLMEKHIREELNMKKSNEDVFIISKTKNENN